MSQFNKLVAKFLALPPQVRFREVCALLNHFGYVEVRAKGSHHTFENAAGQVIVVPKKGGKLVSRTYVKVIVQLLDLENWQNHGQ
ncbi:type II toxin-antitoxin system HicA family toxin [Spirulina major CS-329]|jgi:predicted RNA binding protein YcfA (HicA-like mRNA interferase family)|uniref:type II toxin-antitoxin system HicA family toxin n=1 Tax=Spirulina TaxID=1154 RepID=UPI00232F75D3|nr:MULTISPECIES: type II toxin-antitoxin system HicA family toxin [Spirulina]MDB9494235.1 type II toxin-antitoxin system HicA family toxin [Spirulina subsalsa CS-330]MDB9501850.1 type II toxin-antitoxin system HicA family toxin [Spirulina major CS-329]